jgi:hypothetical protein
VKQNLKWCSQTLWLQTRDTIFIYHSGKGEWQGKFPSYVPYLRRGDSLFRQPPSERELLTLSSDPASLPDSLKRETFFGMIDPDSLLIYSAGYAGVPRGAGDAYIFKPCFPVKDRKKIDEKALQQLIANHSWEINGRLLARGKDGQPEVIRYPAKTEASYKGDPFPDVQGVYKIADGFYFLFVPMEGESIYQIVEVNKTGLVLESLCGKRRQVQIVKKK